MIYKRTLLKNGKWVITYANKDYLNPAKACTFAFDTENFVYCDGKKISQNEIFEKLKNCTQEEKRKRLESVVWSWQIYDEFNGFFMTNDFYTFLYYQCLCGFKFGWCYNAKFDFSQIDYEILSRPDLWKRHISKRNSKESGYNKGQPWTFESIHNDMGSRYAYKLWIPYKNKSRHVYTHAVEYRDFMNLFTGGLSKMLKSLDVEDNSGNKIRKLTMEYQDVNPDKLTDEQIAYCENDVKGLYFGIKKFNVSIEEQSEGECSIFGTDTNLMTAGGFAKRELLRSLYPNLKTNKKRIKQFQKEHPITPEQDKYFRDNKLYRGGICFVNENFRGKMLTNIKMNRYDVNSEYPYAMSVMPDLIEKPVKKSFQDYLKMKPEEQEKYEVIYIFDSITGEVKRNRLPIWYDPFTKNYVSVVNESKTHLLFKREFDEMCEWYNLEYSIENVLLYKKAECRYAPFIYENYELKRKAKSKGNIGLQTNAKLKLNSSYGKLSERCERNTGHYEINPETNAVHFIQDGIEESFDSMLNVVLGSLVTSIARVWILSHIREICGDDMRSNFIYIDTDSIHTLAEYENPDAFSLGGFKLEATCEAVKYLAPKTYIDIEKIDNGIVKDYELHTKGLNIQAVENEFKNQDLTIENVNNIFDYGSKFQCLCAMNVKGGKVLITVDKYLASPELKPDGLVIYNNILSEI